MSTPTTVATKVMRAYAIEALAVLRATIYAATAVYNRLRLNAFYDVLSWIAHDPGTDLPTRDAISRLVTVTAEAPTSDEALVAFARVVEEQGVPVPDLDTLRATLARQQLIGRQ